MTSMQFICNKPIADLAAIHTACQFEETEGTCTVVEQENPHPLCISCPTSWTNASPSKSSSVDSALFTLKPEHSCILNDLSPSNPAILLVRSSNADDTRPFVCSAITILSSARTVELYISGEYTGTFRGDPFLPSNLSSTTSTSGTDGTNPPLFLIQIDQENLLRRCHHVLFKFFIPKKPTTFQDSLTIHWLIVQGALPPSLLRPMTSVSAQPEDSPFLIQPDSISSPNIPIADPITATFPSSSHNLNQLTSPNFSALSSAPTHTSSRISALGSIDVDKVRQMLGQIQLDNMSQGAKDLMRTMEMQALAHRTLASPSATTAEHMLHSPVTSPHPSFAHSIIPSMPSQPYDTRAAITLPSESIEAGKSTVASAVSNASTNSTLFVTKAELEMMEIRIMDKIEQRFQEMEDRIVNKLMLAKQSNYITNE